MEFSKIYNRDEFLYFLRRDFLPDDFTSVYEPIEFATKTTYSKQATKLGVCKSLDLVVYEIEHSGKDDPRVGLSKEAFRMLSEEWQSRALVLFVPENNVSNYRFSLIEIKLEGDQTSAKVHRKYSNPRRYSYLLGEGIGGYTPNKYLAKGKIRENDQKDLQDRFSVEVLTKAFYNELSDWYAWAIDSVEFPGEQLMDTEDRRTEHRSKNVIRLLTRLLFVWFLKQKKLIPWQLFDENYLSTNLLKDFAPNMKIGLFKEKSQDSRYYRAILQNLFFATLNCPITPQSKEDSRERGFRKSDWYGQGFGEDHLMRYQSEFTNAKHFLELVNERVPFLNGDLFDCLDDKQNKTYIDGFSDNLLKPNRLKVPDFLFFGESQGKGQDVSAFYGDKKKKNTDILGLVDILKKYNFTIEENMPFDQEVSLDPELLGKVFENLLASYNPETKTTARKQTGSFYTPREIVQYMVDESLVAHLKRTVGEDIEEEYRKLMRYTDEETILDDDKRLAIIQSLQNCKVLDPACGSGAFPVGVLQQMVHILSQLDPHNELWKNLILDVAVNELSSTLKECTTEERDEIQADINRNFDDSVNRPDYARKLYLIENCIYGVDIQSIAVQISKLRFFISLVVDQKPTQDSNDNFGIRPLPNLEAKFAAANTLIGLNKERNLFDNGDIDKLQAKLVQASHRIFGAKSNKMKNKYKTRVEDLQVQIAEKLESLGVVGNEDARLMRDWKMFDQNASSPFFDPEWMFGVSGGFDIVIANPPYGLFVDKHLQKYYTANFPLTKYKMNLYVLFIERMIQMFDKSIVNFIVPKSLLFNTYYDEIRKELLSKTDINGIFTITDKVFDSAEVGGSLLLCFTITPNVNRKNIIKFSVAEKISNFIFSAELKETFIDQAYFLSVPNYEISFANDAIKLLTGKLRKLDKIETFYTLKNGLNPGNIKHILVSNSRDTDNHKPIVWGKEISRYNIKWGGQYVNYDESIRARLDLSNVKSKKGMNKQDKIDFALRSPKLFEIKKIILRKTGDSLICSLDNENYYFDTLVHGIYEKSDNYSLEFLLAIINSSPATQIYRLLHDIKGKVFAKISLDNISSFPIPQTSIKAQQPFVDLAVKILEAKKVDPKADTTALEKEIDTMVYALYNLTEEEIKIIEK